MVEDDRYCTTSTALESLAFKILDKLVRHCAAGTLTSGAADEVKLKIEERLAAVQRFRTG